MYARLAAIAPGDRCVVDGTYWQVAARAVLRLPDGEFDHLRLFVPPGMPTAAALAASQAHWLRWRVDSHIAWLGAVTLPSGTDAHTLASAPDFTLDGRRYRSLRDDRASVVSLDGDAGDALREGEAVRVLDMTAPGDRLCALWNDRVQWIAAGPRVTVDTVTRWFAAAGKDLAAGLRGPPPLPRGKPVRPGSGGGLEVGSVIALVAMVAFILLVEGCDDDCRQRVNPQTGQTEYVCEDGTIRRSRGWFGK